MSPLLDVRSVGVTVKSARLIDDISVHVDRGAWLSVIGPNGAGKSTLLRAIATGTVSSGTIRVNGSDLGAMSPPKRSRLVSWVPQTPVVPAGMSVLDYVLLGRTPYLHPLANPRPRDLEIVESILADLQLEALSARFVETLSGGERQRTVIARALAQEAPLVLLDEPTSALDLGHQQEVLALLDRLRADGERTIVSTMHDLTLAGAFADELLMLNGGSVAHHGPPRAVLTEPHIAEHYGATVRVEERDGTVIVVPDIQLANPNSKSSGHAEEKQ